MDDVPHIGVPIQIAGSQYLTVQQDTLDEVAACVAVIVSFPLGSREEDPDFGIADPEFRTRPFDVSGIEDACEDYEPRAAVQIYETAHDPLDPLSGSVQIEVDLVTGEDT